MECAAVREFTGVHNMIRGLLRLMDSALLKAKPDNSKQMKVLSDYGTFAVAGAHFHHTTEDDYYWPAVVRNGADPSLLEPLIKEHHMIDPLRVLVRRFGDGMLSHLDHEEPIFFPLLTQYMPDAENELLTKELAKKSPRKGLSWLIGGVEYGMTPEQASEFLAAFPKPIQWMQPLLLRTYKKRCGVLGVDPAEPSHR